MKNSFFLVKIARKYIDIIREGFSETRRARTIGIAEIERIIDQETYKATRGRRGLTAELEDIRQAAWTAIAAAMVKTGTDLDGGYARRTARYAIKAYIKALKR